MAGDPQQASLTFSWSASGGKIIGSGSSVRFDTLGLPTGRYTVTGHLDDGRGGAADCSVNVDSQAPTPLEVRLALHSIYFPTAQPSAEDPTEGLLESQKQILISLADDFKLYLESKPGAHLILEGHADPRGSEGYNLRSLDAVSKARTLFDGSWRSRGEHRNKGDWCATESYRTAGKRCG